jgi:hypothetical protein
VLFGPTPAGTAADNDTVPSALVKRRSAHSWGAPPSMLRHSMTRWARWPATAKVGHRSVTVTR